MKCLHYQLSKIHQGQISNLVFQGNLQKVTIYLLNTLSLEKKRFFNVTSKLGETQGEREGEKERMRKQASICWFITQIAKMDRLKLRASYRSPTWWQEPR